MIWGDAGLLAEIVRVVGADPAIDQLLLCYDQPAEADSSWAAVREGLLAGAGDTEAASLVASTLPDLLDHEAALEFGGRGLPAIAGLRTALACARALRTPPGDAGRLREIAGATRRAQDTAVRRVARRGGDEGAVAPSRDRGPGWRRGRRRGRLRRDRRAHRLAGGAEALGARGPAQERRRRPGARRRRRGGAAGGLRSACGRRPSTARRGFWSSAWSSPGSNCLIAARSDAVVPALVIGLGGIWTESLADVAVVAAAGLPGTGRAGAALAPRRRPAHGRPGPRARRRSRPRPSSPPGSATCCSTRA